MTRGEREVLLAAAYHRLHELMGEAQKFDATDQRKFALETRREHVKPLRNAIAAFRRLPVDE
jgi:hypothetical protein